MHKPRDLNRWRNVGLRMRKKPNKNQSDILRDSSEGALHGHFLHVSVLRKCSTTLWIGISSPRLRLEFSDVSMISACCTSLYYLPGFDSVPRSPTSQAENIWLPEALISMAACLLYQLSPAHTSGRYNVNTVG